MGAIEETYADLDVDVSEEEFREAVEAKVEQMGGLADTETAAMLIAHELSENEVNSVADIEAGMAEAKFLAKVMAIGDLRTFERDGADEEGQVINVEAADETGSVRLAFWDEHAKSVDDGQLDVGQVLRIKGRPKEGYNGLEVSVEQAEPDEDAAIDVEPGDGSSIDGLTMGQSDVTVRGLVLDTDSIRTFDRDDGSEGRVANFTLGDETGRIRVTLWDERADRADEVEAGTPVEIVDGYVRERDGAIELHVGDHGAVDEIDEAVEFEPETDAIADVAIGDTADIGGVVRSVDPVRTFDRDDGSEGQVRNVRVQDSSGDIRIALWGDKAETDVAPGDEIFAAAVEIQDGWQDDKEASANWASTVTRLEGETTTPTAATVDSGESTDEDAGAVEATDEGAGVSGLSEFTDERSTDSADGEPVEFTGTVVQTGDPVVLDDGERTMTVETDHAVMLGQKVTVRGEMSDGHLAADDVF